MQFGGLLFVDMPADDDVNSCSNSRKLTQPKLDNSE